MSDADRIVFTMFAVHCRGVWSSIVVVVIMLSGTGNVLKVQHLLHICSEHYDIKDQVW